MGKTETERKKNGLSFAIHTLGCRVNTYESDAIAQALKTAGFVETDFTGAADVYIVNTCTVTNIADKKSRQMLHRAKKKNPGALVVAVGCYVDAAIKNPQMQAVLSDAAVDLFVQNRDKARLAQLILEKLGIEEEMEESSLFMTELDGHTRAFVKVQDGCNQFCSYCIIPYVRGRIRSRRIADCVEEIRSLSENGVREVVLTGIHLSSYGKDFKAAAEETDTDPLCSEAGEVLSDDIVNTADAPLLSLIGAVHALPGIERIRLGSLEPRLMSEEFVSRLAAFPKLCPHFHLSLQSGCRDTLKRMNRHYTPEEYRESCERLRRYFPHPAITTDVIVGFPGETEAEFEECRRFLEEIGFYEMHIFKYSRRAGTRADRMDAQVPETVKEERSRILLQLADEMSDAFRRYYLGREVSMLCEEEIELPDGRYASGYSREYIRCIRKSADFIQNEIISGTVLEICKEKAVYESLILR